MRGVTPGAEPDAGSGNDAESPSRDPGQAASSAAGPSTTGAETAGQAGDGVPPGAGPTASPDDAKGPAGEEAAAGSAGSTGPAGSRTARRKPPARNRGVRFLRELVILVAIALVIAVVIKT
jgi:hypothetical protein